MTDHSVITHAQGIDGQTLSGHGSSNWTKLKPRTPGWYWMLDPNEAPGLPLVVQIVTSITDETTSALFVLVPASITKGQGMALDLQNVDAIWSCPLLVPSV